MNKLNVSEIPQVASDLISAYYEGDEDEARTRVILSQLAGGFSIAAAGNLLPSGSLRNASLIAGTALMADGFDKIYNQ